MILSLSISASSYNTNFVFLLKSSLHTLFSVLNMLLSITRTMHQLAPNLLLILQISAKASQPQQHQLLTVKVHIFILNSLYHAYNSKLFVQLLYKYLSHPPQCRLHENRPPLFPSPQHKHLSSHNEQVTAEFCYNGYNPNSIHKQFQGNKATSS